MDIMRGFIWAAGTYTAFVGMLYAFQRQAMYFPDTQKPDVAASYARGFQEVSVETDDSLSLTAWYTPPSDIEKPVIVWFHGNALNHAARAHRAAPYIAQGYGMLLASYRGYGGNPGSPTEDGLYADARAFLRWVFDGQGYPRDKVILYGESLGTGVAVKMATEFPGIRALVLESPYTSTLDIAQWRFPGVPIEILMKDTFNSMSRIGQVSAPLIVMHGRRDGIVPYRFGEKLFHAANEPKTMVTIDAAGHNDLQSHGAPAQAMAILGRL